MIEQISAINNYIEKNINKKIVFTNGVFDIIHKGHIEILEYCKSLGDVLIVGINSDISVKSIKGENRPIMDSENRISVLKSIKYVDFVLPFDQKTPVELMKKIVKIDFYVKGGDYSLENLPERDFLKDRGIKIKFFKFKTNISTTKIVENYCSKIR